MNSYRQQYRIRHRMPLTTSGFSVCNANTWPVTTAPENGGEDKLGCLHLYKRPMMVIVLLGWSVDASIGWH